MNMHTDKLNKIKVLIPVLVLVGIFLLLIFNTLRVRYYEHSSLEELDRKVVLVTKISKLLHELQKERGMSVGYLSGSKKSFESKLQEQTKLTDKILQDVHHYYNKYQFDMGEMHHVILQQVRKLPLVRVSILQHAVNAEQASRYYTALNNNLLNMVLIVVKNSKLDNLESDAMAFISLLYLEENSGLERAMGTSILSVKEVKQNMINRFNSYIVKEGVYQDLFLHFASSKFKKLYLEKFSSEEYKKIVEMRENILSADPKKIHTIQAYEWFEYLTKMIDALKEIDDSLSDEILSKINYEYTQSRESFFMYVVMGIMIFIVFIMMIAMILGLKKSELKLKNLLNKYVISSTTDLHGRITGVSKAFCEISGYSEEELLGKPHNIVRHPDVPKEFFEDMWTTIKSGEIWQGEVKNLKKDGSCYWVTAVVSPLYHNGKKVGYTSVRQDITDSKRIEELNKSLKEKIILEVKKSREKDKQMIQQSRLAQMGEMISMIAHQWRQPLTAISATGSSMILKARSAQTVESQYVNEKSHKILEYANHLSNTINDFRDFFKPDKEQKEVTMDALIHSVLGIVQTSLSHQSIEISVKIEYHEQFVSYPNELKQVILNLIKNSEDIFLEKEIEKPLINVKGYKENNSLVIEVSDNAGGVPEDIIEKIFDPYFSTKLKKDGTGLGLYMSKTIVEDHCAGKLEVYNKEEGAAFLIRLPITNRDVLSNE